MEGEIELKRNALAEKIQLCAVTNQLCHYNEVFA